MNQIEAQNHPDSWIKPNDILRIRKKPKRESLKPIQNVPKPLVNPIEPRSTPRIFNPFRKDIPAKRQLDNESPIRSEKMKRQSLILTPPLTPEVSHYRNLSLLMDESANMGTENVKEPQEIHEWNSKISWCLKVKARFISSKPFPWKANLRSSEEASGTTSNVRCLHKGSEILKDCIIDSTPGTKLYQHSLLWIYPNLPWVSTFPRIIPAKAHSRLDKIRSIFCDNASLQESMFSQWCDGFRSLFHLVKHHQCPYFYVCTSTFTALFRASGISGFVGLHILVTPTTASFRELLKAEDIEFSMPLKKDSGSNSSQSDSDSVSSPVQPDSSLENNELEGEKDDTSQIEDANEFLESMGISSLSSMGSKWSYKKYGLDAKQESLILIDGNNSQAFVSFLLNKTNTFERTGPLAGVPPTLLSPTAFVGGCLEPLKIRQAFTVNKEHVMEINGPILPTAIANFGCFLDETMGKGNYQPQFYKYQPTIPFSELSSEGMLNVSSFPFASANLQSTGLDPSILPKFC